jgi:nitroreductase
MKSIEIKTKNTPYNINRSLFRRWSPLSFSSKEIQRDDMNRIFSASAWAASSMNEQPWFYYYTFKKDKDTFNEYLNCLMPGNIVWAKNANVLVLSLAKKHFDRNQKLNRHYMHDVGAANAQLLIQATDMDIYGHIMGGFDIDKTIKTFNIESNIEPVCFIALGYLDDPDFLDEPYKSRELTERTRKDISSFTFEGIQDNIAS